QPVERWPKLMANPEHLEILGQGVEVWNAWRAKEPSVRPDLSGADLARAELRGVNLAGATLMGTNLTTADLSGADLSDANLSGASLRPNFSSLGETSISGHARWREACRQAHLIWLSSRPTGRFLIYEAPRPDPMEAYYRGADLSEADLSKA